MIGKFIIDLKNKLKRHVFYNKILNINGTFFNIPVLLGMRCTIQEHWMPEFLSKVLPRFEGTFIDVGVNLGQTLLALRSVSKSRKYIGFEPNINCAYYVDKLIIENNFAASVVFPFAVGKNNTVMNLHFFSDKQHDSCASLIENFRPQNKVFKAAPVICLAIDKIDGLADERVGFIKIDVEGAEYNVLESFHALIEKYRPAISIEILPAYNKDNVSRIINNENIENFVDMVKYNILQIVKEGSRVNLKPIQKIAIHNQLELCDYLLVPREIELMHI